MRHSFLPKSAILSPKKMPWYRLMVWVLLFSGAQARGCSQNSCSGERSPFRRLPHGDPENLFCKTWPGSFPSSWLCGGAEWGQNTFAAAESPAWVCGCSWRTRVCRWSSCGRSWTPGGMSWTRCSARSATPSRYNAEGAGCAQIPITNPCHARQRACHHCQASGANSSPGSSHWAECGSTPSVS